MRRQLVKDRAAENDLIAIWLYSFERWGVAQVDRYLTGIETATRELVTSPEKGRSRDSLRLAYRSFRRLHHVVFCTFNESSAGAAGIDGQSHGSGTVQADA